MLGYSSCGDGDVCQAAALVQAQISQKLLLLHGDIYVNGRPFYSAFLTSSRFHKAPYYVLLKNMNTRVEMHISCHVHFNTW